MFSHPRPRLFTVTLLALTALGCAPTTPGDAGPASDAGPANDAGFDPCVSIDSLDPELGALTLAAGYELADSASLSDTVVAVAAVARFNGGYDIYAADAASLDVKNLGAWPNLEAGTSVFDVLPAGAASDGVFLSPYLATNDGGHIAAGWTGAFDAATGRAVGQVAYYNGADTTYIDADNNFTASFAGDILLVNGAMLDDADDGAAIYAWDTTAGAAETLATFDSGWLAANGWMGTATNGVVAAGGFYDDGSSGPTNHLIRLPAAAITTALTNDAPIDLAAMEEVDVGALSGASGFGDDLAIIRGDFFTPLEGVLRIPLLDGADRAATPVLSADANGCTLIELVAPMGADLLVGVRTGDDRRLLHVRVSE